MFKLGFMLLVSFGCSFMLSADEWITRTGKVQSESFKIAFPSDAKTKDKGDEFTLYAREGDQALYILTQTTLPKKCSTNETIRRLISHHNTPPKSLISHKYQEVGGKTQLDIENLNSASGAKMKIRYVIGLDTIWELKTVFDNPNQQEHQKFISSFELN